MGSVRLGVGTEWLLDGRAFRIVRQTAAGQFVARDLTFQQEQSLTENEILSLYAAGRLRFAAGEEAPASSPARDVYELTTEQQRVLRDRWDAIEPLTRLERTPRRSDYRQRSAELEALGRPCSPRSLRRYFDRWARAGQDRMALVPATSRRGGRGRSRRTSLLERHPALRQFVDDAIRSVYLTTARRPVSAVTRRVLDDLARRNARLPADQAVPLPRVGLEPTT
ncbi:MAG: hypothetical protein KDA79_05840 [Planctomycetaceae bacterium]|nr:hypothetical protein [Planctomycetaceae bacterium]